MRFLAWLLDKKDAVSAFTDIFSLFASVTALVLLVVTICHISSASNTLKANTIYSIAKDGRELRIQI